MMKWVKMWIKVVKVGKEWEKWGKVRESGESD